MLFRSTSVVKTTDIGTVTSAMLADTYLTTHQDISGKLDKNTPITAGTATKITYDADGLITSGTTLASGDIPDLSGTYVTLSGTQTITSQKSISSIKLLDEMQLYGDSIYLARLYNDGTNGFVSLELDSNNKFKIDGDVVVVGTATGTVTIEDSEIDLSISNNFTINTGGALSFTNLTDGQSGNIIINNVAITSISASIYAPSGLATTLSTAGYYVIGYYVANGVVYITSSTALTAGGA